MIAIIIPESRRQGPDLTDTLMSDTTQSEFEFPLQIAINDKLMFNDDVGELNAKTITASSKLPLCAKTIMIPYATIRL